MIYALVEDNEIKVIGLPDVGTLRDGSTVSGYNLLPDDILISEGWLPVHDLIPEYNQDTHYVQLDGYTISDDIVIANYIALEMQPNIAQPTIEDRVVQLELEKLILQDDNLMALEAIAEVYELNLVLQEQNMVLQEQNNILRDDNLTALEAIAEVYEMILGGA